MRKRRPVTITLEEETVDLLKESKIKTGIPISQMLERAFLKVYGDEKDE